MYADTWRRQPKKLDDRDAPVNLDDSPTNDASRTEEVNRLLEEVQLGSTTLQGLVKDQYAIRARAFQLAVKEFVVGWHEARREHMEDSTR